MRTRHAPHGNTTWRKRRATVRAEGIAAARANYANKSRTGDPYAGKFDAENYALHLAWSAGFVASARIEKRRTLPLGHFERVDRRLDWKAFTELTDKDKRDRSYP